MAIGFPIKTKVVPRNELKFSGAINLGQVRDWEEPVFIDRAKQARGWNGAAVLDSLDRCASLSSGTTATFFFCAYEDTGGIYLDNTYKRGGRFQAKLISGSATGMTASFGSNVVSTGTNTWEFDHPWELSGELGFQNASNFPLEVSIIRTDRLANHANGEIFEPDWLATIPTGTTLRFMDWMGTNFSPIVNEADYPTLASQKWHRVPFEVMVALCNLKSSDMWVCWPHAATDDFVTTKATYIKNNLNSGLKLIPEYSNEIWNTATFGGSTGQSTWLKTQAETVWGVTDGFSNPSGAWQSYAGKRFAQMTTVVNTVFSGQTDRVLPVIAGQAAVPSVAGNIAVATHWQTYEPGSYVPPHTLARHISIAPYLNFGSGGINATTAGNAIKTQLDISQAAAVAYITDTMLPLSLAQSKEWIDAHVALAETYGCDLTMYEYNQHYNMSAFSGSTLYSGGAPVAGAMDALLLGCYSTKCSDTLEEMRGYFKRKGGTIMAFFVHMNRATIIGGQWGMQTNIGHTNPLRTGWDAWHSTANNPAWY